MSKAKYHLICGVVLTAPLALTPYTEAQAASYLIDSVASSLTLNVTREETTLSGTWDGTAASVGGSFGEKGTYTVKLEENSTTSSSALQGGFLVTKQSNSLAFGFSSVSATSPDDLAGDLSIIDSIGAIETAGSTALQQKIDYPFRAPMFVGGFSPYDPALKEAINFNFGEVFNYGFFYDTPLNGQTPVGDYSASPGSQSVSVGNLANTTVNFSGLVVGDLQYLDTLPFQNKAGIAGLIDWAEPDLGAFDVGLGTLFNSSTVVSGGGFYRPGVDEDEIVLRFDYRTAITSTIQPFHTSTKCAESPDFGTFCSLEQFIVTSPTGTITTTYGATAYIVARSAGTLPPPPPPDVNPVPLPAALPLLLSALGFFGFAGWRRKQLAAA
jgi:hypothetical protein